MLKESLAVDAGRQGVEKLVVGAVKHDEGKALLVTRSDADDFLPGIEELPSGGVDPGETPLDALDRELVEEIGLPAGAIDDGLIACFDYLTGSGRRARQFTVSIASYGRSVTLSDEHSAWRWIDRTDLGASSATTATKQS